jgi:phosphoglycerol transferase MdoB-like AlkP superfamily enzyme
MLKLLKKPALRFTALVVAAVLVPLVCFLHTFAVEATSAPLILFDLALIMLPALWIGRQRWAMLLPAWGMAIFALTNYWYLRAYLDMMPMESYLLWSNVDSVLFHSLRGLIRPIDAIMLVFPICATVYYFRRRRAINAAEPLPLRSRVKFTAAILAAFAVLRLLVPAYGNYVDRKNGVSDSDLSESYAKVLYQFTVRESCQDTSRPSQYGIYGMPLYLAKQIGWTTYRHLRSRTLSPDERLMVDRYLSHIDSLRVEPIASAGPRNVLLIIVESPNAWVIDKQFNGHYVCPNIQAALRDSTTLWCDQVVKQTGIGRSSDGVFLYNTGILPSQELTVVTNYTENTYHALPKVFSDKFSSEVMFEHPQLWAHDKMNRAYGYKHMVSTLYHYDHGTHKSEDGLLTTRTLELLDSVADNFFVEITTISMHSNYCDPQCPMPQWIASLPVKEQLRDYFNVTHGFDAQLGRIIAYLKRRGIYRDTLILVASDHTDLVDGATKEENQSPYIFFMALNSPVGGHVDHPVGQVDIFPTILEISGRAASAPWQGMGLSILNPNNDGTLRHLDGARPAAELILRSDYFRTFPR